MGALSRILNVAAMVVYLTVGCCSHPCESKPCSPPVHSNATPDERASHCRCDHSHHKTRDCQGVTCSLISPRRTASGSLIAPFQVLFVALRDGQHTRGAIGSQQHSQATACVLLPVRLHLANQVLLI